MIFCILDRAQPYAKVKRSFEALDSMGLTTRNGLQNRSLTEVEQCLRSAGYRFPKQAAECLKDFSTNPIDLSSASRDELAESVKGVGLKIASLFVRNTRNEQVAVLDIHIKRWLKETLDVPMETKYHDAERIFLEYCENHGLDPCAFDIKLWEQRRKNGSQDGSVQTTLE